MNIDVYVLEYLVKRVEYKKMKYNVNIYWYRIFGFWKKYMYIYKIRYIK